MKASQEPKYEASYHWTSDTNDNGQTMARLYNRKSGEAIPDDEPVFILRARDYHAYNAIKNYASLISAAQGYQSDHHLAVLDRAKDFRDFAENHPKRMKEPDT